MENKSTTQTNKEIHFYQDMSEWLNVAYYTHDSTKMAIDFDVERIDTCAMSVLSFDLISIYNYRIFLHKNKKQIEIKPHMEELEKDLRIGHNILKLFLAKVFDECFEKIN